MRGYCSLNGNETNYIHFFTLYLLCVCHSQEHVVLFLCYIYLITIVTSYLTVYILHANHTSLLTTYYCLLICT